MSVDYSNTIIYKIYCKDESIDDVYVGHTTNFTKRKYQHKICCNKTNEQYFKLKIYKTIRDNGGWDNWDMIEIAKYNCNDATEARIKEQEHYELLKSTLNTRPPYSGGKVKYYCSLCKLNFSEKKIYNEHINSSIHNNKIILNKDILVQTNEVSYECKLCDFKCSKLSNYNIHILTFKHNTNIISDNIIENNNLQLSDFKCEICGKKYKGRNGLWYHNKKCKEPTVAEVFANNNTQQITEIMLKMIEQNKDLTDKIFELAKNSGNNYNNTNNVNSHNKFNLNVYLNETCKDAMNITDFVDSLVVTVKDLEETGRLGYTEGISKIFLNGLSNMNTHSRPIHCSDSKREILYIKDKDKWEKDNETNDKITKAIKTVAHKNMKMIPEWVKQHPDYNDVNSKTNDKYLKIVFNSMSGSTEEEQKKNINKIISNVAKETVIIK